MHKITQQRIPQILTIESDLPSPKEITNFSLETELAQNPNKLDSSSKSRSSKSQKNSINFSARFHLELKNLKTKRTSTPHQTKSPKSRKDGNSLKTSILESKNNCEFFFFFLKKIFLPICLISILIISLILMQSYIGDFCFYHGLCKCENIGIYFYSYLREIIHFDSIIGIWSYFVAAYLTQNFFNRALIRNLFLVLQISILTVVYFYFWNKKDEFFLPYFRIYRSVVIMAFALSYIFVTTFFLCKINKNFFKKLLKIGFFTGFYFIHGLYLKNTFFLVLLEFLIQTYPQSAKNIFKLILLFYYGFYNYIGKRLVLDFYQEAIVNPESFPIEMIVGCTKFIFFDVVSVHIMNVLTIPLDEVYSWISFANYIYSLVTGYLGYNFGNWILKKIKAWIRRKKKTPLTIQKIDEYSEKWNQLRRGCILDSNIIVFTRIIIFFFYRRFFYITKNKELFLDCSLGVSESVGSLLEPNLILIFCSHTGIVALILTFMAHRKKMILEVIVEDFGIILRALFFIIYFTQVDVCIQFYMEINMLR